MKNFEPSSFFYNDAIKLIDLNDLGGAIKLINQNIYSLENTNDIALAYLNCGFLNDKLGDYISAIEYFSKSIYIESELQDTYQISKDVSYSGRSNSRYKNGDYHGAIEDKRQAKKIRLKEIDKYKMLNNIKIDYRNILLGTFTEIELDPKYNTLIKVSQIKRSKYDLIADYKKVISNKRKEEVIDKLELLSEAKYEIGDYKGSIKAIRRAEKYY